jgi:hypothetical protein
MPSSVVAKMIYDASSSSLRIIYTSGAQYDYLHVPQQVYEAMKTASSKGTFLNNNIKGKYDFKKVA